MSHADGADITQQKCIQFFGIHFPEFLDGAGHEFISSLGADAHNRSDFLVREVLIEFEENGFFLPGRKSCDGFFEPKPFLVHFFRVNHDLVGRNIKFKRKCGEIRKFVLFKLFEQVVTEGNEEVTAQAADVFQLAALDPELREYLLDTVFYYGRIGSEPGAVVKKSGVKTTVNHRVSGSISFAERVPVGFRNFVPWVHN